MPGSDAFREKLVKLIINPLTYNDLKKFLSEKLHVESFDGSPFENTKFHSFVFESLAEILPKKILMNAEKRYEKFSPVIIIRTNYLIKGESDFKVLKIKINGNFENINYFRF